MNTFRIEYKSFYHESSDHHSDYIHATNRNAALKTFARKHNIPRASRQKPESWQWWDGAWLYEFRNIECVTVFPCPRCSGKGEIFVIHQKQ